LCKMCDVAFDQGVFYGSGVMDGAWRGLILIERGVYRCAMLQLVPLELPVLQGIVWSRFALCCFGSRYDAVSYLGVDVLKLLGVFVGPRCEHYGVF